MKGWKTVKPMNKSNSIYCIKTSHKQILNILCLKENTSAEDTRRGTREPPIWTSPSAVNRVTLSSGTHSIAINTKQYQKEKRNHPLISSTSEPKIFIETNHFVGQGDWQDQYKLMMKIKKTIDNPINQIRNKLSVATIVSNTQQIN